ncbi:BgiBsFReDn23 [Biomphalaria glabrata]|nr:BgiBsFReDn23 [Biomphalaria glabrata]
MYRLLFLMLQIVIVLSRDSLQTSKYRKSQVCFAQQRILKGCMLLAGNKPISGMRCAMACSAKVECEGYSLELETSKCYIRTNCAGLASVCAQQDDGFQHFKRLPTPESCTNGGFWDTSLRACTCVHSFAGKRCERKAESCEEVFEFGQEAEMLESVIVLYPCLAEIFTYCSVRSGDVITHVASYTGSGNFNRGWADYVTGFANNSTGKNEFWIGLENIRCLTARAFPQDLIINLTLSPPLGSSSSFTIEYTQFTVGNASTFYRYNFATFSSSKTGPLSPGYNINNCLGPPTGQGFSTPDADHDNDPMPNTNAAFIARSGWWFCLPQVGVPPPCNPFGLMFSRPGERISPEHMKFDTIALPGLYNYKVLVEMYLMRKTAA